MVTSFILSCRNRWRDTADLKISTIDDPETHINMNAQMVRLYGIPNCGTMKKARQWLAEHGVEYEFHDYKKAGIDERQLRQWTKKVGWERLLNRRGTTWRKLDESVKANIDEAGAIRIMLENPSIIKRPVLTLGSTLHLGFDPAEYEKLFA
jgi:arsenate reductase (glutaredoxin)